MLLNLINKINTNICCPSVKKTVVNLIIIK